VTSSYVTRLLRLFVHDLSENVTWRVDESGAPTFEVNCNDLFWWGTADAEEVERADVDALERAFADARAADPEGVHWAAELWVARKRGLRPQGAAYAHVPTALHALFDAAGPPREVEFTNPYPTGEAYRRAWLRDATNPGSDAT
jgi:hypothetical protein